jgi:hypothetical protein
LTPEQLRAWKIQTGYAESGLVYDKTNQFGYLGKYQMGAAALADLGYIKLDAYRLYGQRALDYPSSWTGRDGIASKGEFLSSSSVQENAMDRLASINYNRMVQSGTIRSSDSADMVAGKLSVAHLLGSGGANTWTRTGLGQDANNTSGTRYYNEGRYAVIQLARGP